MLRHLVIVTYINALVTIGRANYADQANNIEFQGEGLPDQATLDGRVTKLDDLSPVIFLNRTKAALNCAAGSMQVELKFNERFYGRAYADFERNSPCKITGKGDYSYKIELPLKGCGTKQEPQRVFTNNIVVRFHPGLEMDGDEIITIVCRYPPPVAPPPPGLPSFIQEDLAPVAALEPPLKGFQILLIICAILFLSLLLLGLGCSYYCLRKRHVTVIRHPFSSIGTGSEITKLSGSSLGNLSMFEGLKIPRVHAPMITAPSSAGSDGLLISDTLPSDYPSESHSENEDVDTRSLPSAGSFENKAFVQDNSSFYSEEIQTIVPRLPVMVKEPPRFEVQVKVKKAPAQSVHSLNLSDSDESTIISAPAKSTNLSTIVEQREESIRSLESPRMVERTQFTYVPELHPPPKHIQPAPTYNRILRKQALAPPPPVIPELTSHEVDDVYLRTITEKRTIEDIERYKRMITEYHTKQAADQKWDVTIRNYPLEMPNPPEWENFSDISSVSNVTLTPRADKSMQLPQSQIDDNKLPLNSPELVGNLASTSATTTTAHHTSLSHHMINNLEYYQLPYDNPEVPNWNVLLRVFNNEHDDYLVHSDRVKWRQIITTESTLRTLLTEATIREDYERIRHDQRYEPLFEPHKWDVIIRILTPVDRPNKPRYSKKKAEWDNRSRRSSLPTLYEYDSDIDVAIHPTSKSIKSSSYRSEADLRSMSEMIVDFGRFDYQEDDYHSSLARSLSQPSLARSASEFTERWIAPRFDDALSSGSSHEGTPKSQRSAKMWSAATSATMTSSGVEGGRVVREEASTSFMHHHHHHHHHRDRKNWFGDNESENSFK